MKATITKTTEQPLLLRSEIKATVAYEGAIPSRTDIAKELAGKTKSELPLLVVSLIKPLFGMQQVEVTAYAYQNKEALARIQEKKRLKRTGFAEAKAPAAEGAQ